MQKRATIITIIVTVLVFIGVTLGIYFMVSAKNSQNLADITSKVETKQAEVNKLKAAKDTNGFTPTEVVQAFWTDVKADSTDQAKLYLAPEVQNMDIKASLKLGSDLVNITLGENSQELDSDTATVNMTFLLTNDETTVRTFNLSKYDGAWKITGVVAQ